MDLLFNSDFEMKTVQLLVKKIGSISNKSLKQILAHFPNDLDIRRGNRPMTLLANDFNKLILRPTGLRLSFVTVSYLFNKYLLIAISRHVNNCKGNESAMTDAL